MPATSRKRRFECISGGSDKFWSVEITGCTVVVRYGRNGTHGQSETKTFQDVKAAVRYAEGKIKEKVKKGYVEVL